MNYNIQNVLVLTINSFPLGTCRTLIKFCWGDVSDPQNPDCSFLHRSPANALLTVHLISTQYYPAQFPLVVFVFLNNYGKFWISSCTNVKLTLNTNQRNFVMLSSATKSTVTWTAKVTLVWNDLGIEIESELLETSREV